MKGTRDIDESNVWKIALKQRKLGLVNLKKKKSKISFMRAHDLHILIKGEKERNIPLVNKRISG